MRATAPPEDGFLFIPTQRFAPTIAIVFVPISGGGGAVREP
jgi:hypothetical protein